MSSFREASEDALNPRLDGTSMSDPFETPSRWEAVGVTAMVAAALLLGHLIGAWT